MFMNTGKIYFTKIDRFFDIYVIMIVKNTHW